MGKIIKLITKESALVNNLKRKKILNYIYIISFLGIIIVFLLKVNNIYDFSSLAPLTTQYIGILSLLLMACSLIKEVILYIASLIQKEIRYTEKKEYLMSRINSRKKANEEDKELLEYISKNQLRKKDREYTAAKHNSEEVAKITT